MFLRSQEMKELLAENTLTSDLTWSVLNPSAVRVLKIAQELGRILERGPSDISLLIYDAGSSGENCTLITINYLLLDIEPRYLNQVSTMKS